MLKNKLSNDTTDTYMSEGMTYGLIVGVIIFFISLILGKISYGSMGIFVCVGTGMLIGLAMKKPKKQQNQDLEQEIEKYKKLDRKNTAFLGLVEIIKYDKRLKKPMLRTNVISKEQVAGLMDLSTGEFEEKMLIRNKTDMEKFIYAFQITNTEDVIQKEI